METLLVPKESLYRIRLDLETFLDLGLWGAFFKALEQLEELLGERDHDTF